MAKDDYHVIVYQILSYLYACLKNGEPVDPEKLSAEQLFGINEQYRGYIFFNIVKSELIRGVEVKEKEYINGVRAYYLGNLINCEITPKGIEYLSDHSFMKKAKVFFQDAKSIVPFV